MSGDFEQYIREQTQAYADWMAQEIGHLVWGKDLAWDQEDSLSQRQMIYEVLNGKVRSEIDQALEAYRQGDDQLLAECLDRYTQRSSSYLQQQAEALLADNDLETQALQALVLRAKHQVRTYWEEHPPAFGNQQRFLHFVMNSVEWEAKQALRQPAESQQRPEMLESIVSVCCRESIAETYRENEIEWHSSHPPYV